MVRVLKTLTAVMEFIWTFALISNEQAKTLLIFSLAVMLCIPMSHLVKFSLFQVCTSFRNVKDHPFWRNNCISSCQNSDCCVCYWNSPPNFSMLHGQHFIFIAPLVISSMVVKLLGGNPYACSGIIYLTTEQENKMSGS